MLMAEALLSDTYKGQSLCLLDRDLFGTVSKCE